MKSPTDVTDITTGIEHSEDDVCIQFPKGWTNDQAKIWLEQHNLKCCEVIPDRPFRWVAWSRPLVCSPTQEGVYKCPCGWTGNKSQLRLYKGLGSQAIGYCCPLCETFIPDTPTIQNGLAASISCSCGWKGLRGDLKHTGTLTHADDWWCCPQCNKDVRTMLDEQKKKSEYGEIVCLCGWTGDRNMLTWNPKMLGHKACPKCGNDLTLAIKALKPKN